MERYPNIVTLAFKYNTTHFLLGNHAVNYIYTIHLFLYIIFEQCPTIVIVVFHSLFFTSLRLIPGINVAIREKHVGFVFPTNKQDHRIDELSLQRQEVVVVCQKIQDETNDLACI